MIPEAISNLFRLSMVIQKATPRDRFQKALASTTEPFDVSFDVAHVGSKFPRLESKESEWLKQRLGKAITQRRQYLRYAREHREKKARHQRDSVLDNSQQKPPTSEPDAQPAQQVKLDDRSVLSGQKPPSTLTPTAASTLIVARLEDAEHMSDTAVSRTSFVTSVNEDDGTNALKVPALKDLAKVGTAFECPFCWTIQTFRSQSTWK